MDFPIAPCIKKHWLRIQILISFTLFAVLFFPSLKTLFLRWIQWDQDLSHALPTVGIFIYLTLKIKWPNEVVDSHLQRVIFIVIGGSFSFLWLILYLARIDIASYILLLVLLLVFFAGALSLNSAKKFLPSLGILVFTIPLWGQLNGVLVDISAFVVGYLIRALQITAIIDGQNITLPYGQIFIAEGCSGLRYLTISILIAYLLAQLNNYGLKRSLITIVIACVLGLIANWVRIFIIVLIGYYTNMQSSLVTNHEFFGWVIFGCIMLPCIYFSPYVSAPKEPELPAPKFKPFAPLIALSLGPVIAWGLALHPAKSTFNTFNLPDFPSETTLTKGSDFNFRVPQGAIFHSEKNLLRQQIPVQVVLNHYEQRSRHEKLVPYMDLFLNPEEWLQVARVNASHIVEKKFEINLFRRFNSNQYIALLHRYEVGSLNASSYTQAKLLQIPALLKSENYFNLILMASECRSPDCAKEIDVLSSIAEEWDVHSKPHR